MQTNDEETRHFFKHSSVKVLLCPRSAGKGHSFVKKQVGILRSCNMYFINGRTTCLAFCLTVGSIV